MSTLFIIQVFAFGLFSPRHGCVCFRPIGPPLYFLRFLSVLPRAWGQDGGQDVCV